MIKRMIASENRPLITSIDFDRLCQLTETARYRKTHSALLAGLKSELQNRDVIAPICVPRGVVTMNSRVRLRDTARGQNETYTLVYPESADITQEKLSVLAPLGAALLGSRTGQTIQVKTPGGIRRLKVERILYQPEAAGDYHL
jgi:regulator of nucleoside diphosphate kinase